MPRVGRPRAGCLPRCAQDFAKDSERGRKAEEGIRAGPVEQEVNTDSVVAEGGVHPRDHKNEPGSTPSRRVLGESILRYGVGILDALSRLASATNGPVSPADATFEMN